MGRIFVLKTGCTLPELIATRGDFEDWILSGMGIRRDEADVCDVAGGQPLPGYAEVDGIVVTGSHAMVTDHSDWSERTAEWLRGAIERRIPALGICYGHQLLAYALGATVGPNPYGSEYGTTEVALNEEGARDPLFAGLPNPFPAHVGHKQSALTLPENARLLASSRMDPHQAFAIGDFAWGVQFHPEFDAEIGRTYIRREWQTLAREGQEPERLIEASRETPGAAEILRRFAARITRGGGTK